MIDASVNNILVIDYGTIRDLALFQEQYDRLTDEMQQVRVQLESSPALEPDAPGGQQRAEWRSWLQLQIKSKQHDREKMVQALAAKNIRVEHLPE